MDSSRCFGSDTNCDRAQRGINCCTCCHCLQIQQLEHLQQLTLCRTTGHSRPCSTIDPMTYQQKLKAVLSPAERTIFAALNSPKKIQDYLDTLPINFETAGETYMSPRRVIRNQTAH